MFRFASFDSPMASRRNEDGSISFVAIEPIMLRQLSGTPLVVANSTGKRDLILRDGQHEYCLEEAK